MKTIVVKIGGAVAADRTARDALWPQLRTLRKGAHVVLVHGGGPQATGLARRLGHTPKIVRGRRVTSDLDLRVVAWTMRGELNATLAAEASGAGLRAAGISGADAGLVRVRKRPPWIVDGRSVDFGWVGDIEAVDTAVLDTLLAGGFLPVVASLSADAGGRLFNVNADTVAWALAGALRADELLLVTGTGGLLRDAADASTVVARCTRLECEEGLDSGWIAGGMGVKIRVALRALSAGVGAVYVLGARDIAARRSATRVVR